MDGRGAGEAAVPGAGGGRLRILHVLRAPLGGLFRHVVDVARLQVEAGHAVGVFCDATTGGGRAAEVLGALAPDLALGVTRVPMRRNPHPIDAAALLSLARLARRQRPDVLHGHGSKGGAYARLVVVPGRERETIRAYTPHGGSFNYRPGTPLHRLYMMAEAALTRRTDVFLFESAYVADRYRAFVGETERATRVVHNGIAEAEFAPIETVSDPFDLVYVGELREAKGVGVLIDALGRIRHERGLRLTLLVVGSGPNEADLHARARARGVWDSTAFVPPRPIRDALGRGAIMVIPSLAESLPYVILEAAAARQPLVATRVGGIPEIFGPGADALVPPDDVEALMRAILAKRDEPEARRRAEAEALAAFVRTSFSMRQMGEGVLAGYAAAFAARGIARPDDGREPAGPGVAAAPREAAPS